MCTHSYPHKVLVDWTPELVSHGSCYVSWGLWFTVNVFVLDFLWFVYDAIRDHQRLAQNSFVENLTP